MVQDLERGWTPSRSALRLRWGDLEFPMPFGRSMTSAEEYVADLDSKTGASLKLSILNPKAGHPPAMRSAANSPVARMNSSMLFTACLCYLPPSDQRPPADPLA